jgi:hypothetical protein
VTRLVAVAIALLAAACASERPAQRPASRPAAEKPLARSSVAALLEHRAELALRDDQVAQLSAVDVKLAQANDQLRASAEAQLAAPGAGVSANHSQQTGRGSPRRCMSCGSGRPEEAIEDPAIRVRLQELVDDNDRKAFASVEPLLDPGQRAIARAVVARYFEQLLASRGK